MKTSEALVLFALIRTGAWAVGPLTAERRQSLAEYSSSMTLVLAATGVWEARLKRQEVRQ